MKTVEELAKRVITITNEKSAGYEMKLENLLAQDRQERDQVAEQRGIEIGRKMMSEEMHEQMKVVYGLELYDLHKKHFNNPK